ncbi:MAG: hypothetical protein ACQEXQ_01190 [Bacillota bacterium]
MKRSYEKNKTFTEDDQAKKSKLMKEVTVLMPLISKVYYVPESHEGAEVTLKINNKEELIEFKVELPLLKIN